MTHYQQAQEILRQDPLPKDARAQIDVLRDAADQRERDAMFPFIYEALFYQENKKK